MDRKETGVDFFSGRRFRFETFFHDATLSFFWGGFALYLLFEWSGDVVGY